ncbi:hypothetical protein [Streptomyces sp. NPDC020298]|uniref:hypothetical protein n=1 Tax=unclassified Streptomyces TaxID=2593676 RepID=UPI0033D6F1BD
MNQPRLARALTVFHAWMEDSDWWDGNALYLDLDTAKTRAAYDYEGDEYGHFDDEGETDEPRSKPDFSWVWEHGSWHLLDHGKNTLVQVSETTIYRAATLREVQQQDALMAAEEAERAAKPQLPLREALEAEAARRAAAVPAVVPAANEDGDQ